MIFKTPEYFIIKLYNKLKDKLYELRINSVLYNVNGVNESEYSKRALLIYIVRPFLGRDASSIHQNRRQSKQIVKLLDESGYIVDVIDINNINYQPHRDYDIVISNRTIDTPLNNNAIRIYLATTIYRKLHNANLQRRHELLYKRRGSRVQLRRVYSDAMPYVAKSDAIIGFGNEFVMETWGEVFKIPTYPFNNYGFKETKFLLDSKDFSLARKNFLFFASKSQMQKGLDLLLEIFPKHQHLHLYICSEYKKEEDFCACYHKELYETPNIHPVGWVTVNGPKYNELVRKCAYVIHPSCSDGQPGSVIQCMYSGLIPIVTKEAGIDTEDFGITFTDDSLEEIERVIVEVSGKPEGWHRQHCIKTREVSEEKYSEDAFIDRWRRILDEITRGGSGNDRNSDS